VGVTVVAGVDALPVLELAEDVLYLVTLTVAGGIGREGPLTAGL
jgi:hypothetical protein